MPAIREHAQDLAKLRRMERGDDQALARRVAFRGALLVALGMVTGLWAGLALTDKVKVPIPHLALAAHLNGFLGGLWLIAIGTTLPLLSYGPRGRERLVGLAQLATYGNWAVTLVASLLGVRGLELTRDVSNDVIAGLLQVTVVIPTLVVCVAWVMGLRKKS